jgi:hypothetical protein
LVASVQKVEGPLCTMSPVETATLIALIIGAVALLA